MYEKSTKVSINSRQKGNEAYKKSDFRAALIFYNKAIAFAPPVDGQDLCFAYGNRSAVYFELKKYDDCLKNILLARKHGHLGKELKEREERAKNLKTEQRDTIESFFKLSYDCHSKIPFIIDRLKVKKTETYGRGIYTTRKLHPGDIIAIEKPVISIVSCSNDARYMHCCYCMKSSMMNLLPCKKTAGVMFCSEVCRDKTYSRTSDPINMISGAKFVNGPKLLSVGLAAFETVENFQNFVQNYVIKSGEKTIFDYDLNPNSKNYKRNMLNCILSLQYKKFMKKDGHFDEIAGGVLKFMDHIAGVIDMNSIGFQYVNMATIRKAAPTYELHGQAVLAFGSLLNHSCDPNVQRIAVDDKIVFIVCKPIDRDQQLFINYVGDFFNKPLYERRESLQRYQFTCHCDACDFRYQRENLIQPYENHTSPLLRPPPKCVENCITELQDNFKFIEDHSYNILTLPNYERIQRNMDLLAYAAYYATFPY